MLATIAKGLLRLGGWRIEGSVPQVRKAVLIAAPHTSNWDGIWGMIAKVALKLDLRFFAKASLFWFPLGQILRALGGVPVDRSRPGGAVQQALDMFERESRLIFGLSPEGTRRHSRYWKTGFYRIAREAGVPLILAYFDYKNRRIGIGPAVDLTGDRDADLEMLRDYFRQSSAKHPDKVGPIEFRPDEPAFNDRPGT